jgi:hypothetical protein
MTHDEMRRQLAWAQGWTDITTSSDGDLYGSPPGTADPDEWDTVPDPLEDDSDAALLRAWCAGRGWRITCCHDEGAAWWRVSDLRCQGPRAESMADAKEEPDYCRRERLALCRAVVQVIEDAGL